MKTVFKYKSSDLSEEHIKQICRFSDRLYVKGEYQRMQGYIQFKIWHKRQMDKRDALIELNCKKLII